MTATTAITTTTATVTITTADSSLQQQSAVWSMDGQLVPATAIKQFDNNNNSGEQLATAISSLKHGWSASPCNNSHRGVCQQLATAVISLTTRLLAAACNSRQQVDARIVSTHQQATAISQGVSRLSISSWSKNQQIEVKHSNAALQLESSAAGSNSQQLKVKLLNAALQLESSKLEATISSLTSSIWTQRCSLNHQQL
jgi:hypothetical protein